MLVERGDEVRSLSRGLYPELQALGVETLQGDVRDPDAVRAACRGVEAVFHVAAISGIWGPWELYFEINTRGTEHVLQACQAERVSRLVYTSSPSVTFDGGDQCGVNESAPYPNQWLCHYPHSKALAEQCVLAADGEAGLRTCALRPHLIWGPGDPHLVPRLLERARAGQLRRVGDGQNLIDVTFIDNAAEAHLQAADRLEAGSPVCGRAYFLSQGEPVNCWGWINQLLELAGLPPIERSVSLAAAWRIGSVLETVHRVLRLRTEPRMTRFLAAQLGRSHYFDTRHAQEDFGYAPRISMQEGMQRLANSWLNR
jgi:nucleoside-diphosphate-sugar epimerase